MRRLKAQAVWLTAIIVVHPAWAPAHASEASAAARLEAEAAKQSSIYESRGSAVPEGYVIDRSLLSYTFVLPSQFKQSLADLAEGDRWLDVGAGEGRAVLDYATGKYASMLQGRGRGKGQAVAMSIEDRRTRQWHESVAALGPKQVSYLAGKRFREYSATELGRFDVITDVVGAFSYTRDLSRFMEQALQVLDVSGSLYTVLQDVRSAEGASRPHYPDAPFLTELTTRDGSEVKVCSWLKSITCVEVSCEAKPQFSPPIEVYSVRKTCEAVSVPRLELVHFQAGTPPERRFQLIGSQAGR